MNHQTKFGAAAFRHPIERLRGAIVDQHDLKPLASQRLRGQTAKAIQQQIRPAQRGNDDSYFGFDPLD
jgi:hypothetical protein